MAGMERSAVLSLIFDSGIVPVVRTPGAEAATRTVEALVRGGIRAVEIPMTVPGALDALQRLVERFGDEAAIGAGTVLDGESARKCLQAGARFIFSPCLKAETLDVAKRYSVAVMPGALTPTEVLTAWEAGADAVRIVPCDAVGGVKFIRSLRAPFPHIDMLPTGGVTLDNIADYFRAGARAVGVSGALIDSESLRNGSYEIFTVRARRFVDTIRRTRELLHGSSSAAD